MSGAESHALGMVAGRARYHTAGFLFFRELRYLIIGPTEFERAGELQIFRFQPYIGLRVDLRSGHKSSVAGNTVEHASGIEYFVYFEHYRKVF